MEPVLPLRGQLMTPFAPAACGLVPEAGKTLTASYMLLPNTVAALLPGRCSWPPTWAVPRSEPITKSPTT